MANYNQNRRDNRSEWDDMDENKDRPDSNATRRHSYNAYDHRNDYASGWRGNDNYHSINAQNQDFGNDYAGGSSRQYGSGQGAYQHRDHGYGSNRYGSNNYGSGERGNYTNYGRGFSEGSYRNDDRDRNYDDYTANNGRDQQGYSRNDLYRGRQSGNRNYYGSGNAYTEGGYSDRDNAYGNYSGSQGNRGYTGNQERSMWDRGRDEVASWFGDDEAEHRRQQDHRGRGPKGYKRSDERITEDINDKLSDDYMVDASEIEVTVKNGEVSLMGSVTDRQAKRRAEDIAEAVSGVSNVENRIRVRQEQGTTTLQSTNASSQTPEQGKDKENRSKPTA